MPLPALDPLGRAAWPYTTNDVHRQRVLPAPVVRPRPCSLGQSLKLKAGAREGGEEAPRAGSEVSGRGVQVREKREAGSEGARERKGAGREGEREKGRGNERVRE